MALFKQSKIKYRRGYLNSLKVRWRRDLTLERSCIRREMSCMSDEICLIDTNILVYAYDESEGKKHEICKGLIDECWRLRKKYSISIQNLSEFYVVITKKKE